jgi:hypothetical protein
MFANNTNYVGDTSGSAVGCYIISCSMFPWINMELPIFISDLCCQKIFNGDIAHKKSGCFYSLSLEAH